MHPQASGQLSDLLYDVALAAKIISGNVRSAGLVDVLGAAGHTNVQGEELQAEEADVADPRSVAGGRLGVPGGARNRREWP